MKIQNLFKNIGFIALMLTMFSFAAPTLINLVQRAKPGANNTMLQTNAAGDVEWAAKNSAFSAGTGITIGADGLITNIAPDEVVSFTNSGIATVTGTYPNFTVDATEQDGDAENEAQDLTTSGTTTPVVTLSQVGTSGGGSFSFAATGGLVWSNVGGVFTIDGAALGTGTLTYSREITNLTANTTTVSVTLIYDVNDTDVYVDGVLMEDGASADFTHAGGTLTFSNTLLSGQKVTVKKAVIS